MSMFKQAVFHVRVKLVTILIYSPLALPPGPLEGLVLMKHLFFALPPFINLRTDRGERKREKGLHNPSIRNRLCYLLQHPSNIVLPILRQPLQHIHGPSGSVYSLASFIIPSLLSSRLDDVRSNSIRIRRICTECLYRGKRRDTSRMGTEDMSAG